MTGYDVPDRCLSDEERWDYRHAPSALCEACGQRAGAVHTDGDWLCEVCDAALELATPVVGRDGNDTE